MWQAHQNAMVLMVAGISNVARSMPSSVSKTLSTLLRPVRLTQVVMG